MPEQCIQLFPRTSAEWWKAGESCVVVRLAHQSEGQSE